MQPKIVANYHDACGENPLWHPTEHVLYWTDIPDGELYRFDPKSGKTTHFPIGKAVGGFTFQADGALLLFMAKGEVRLWRDGDWGATILSSVPGEEGSRFNDVMADPEGRVFCGTMPTPGGKKGALYRLDTDHSLTPLLTGIGCSNGMGFTLDGKQMYYTDTGTRSIYLFDYDRNSGALSNQRTHILVPQTDDGGAPDGMVVDSAGHVWSARWGGSRITHYDADGQELDHIDLPAPCITSLIYGGEDLRDVYVTSAVGGAKDPVDAAGALFHYRAEVPGRPEYVSRIQER